MSHAAAADHNAHDDHEHEHHIVSLLTLRTILVTLVFLTLLTSGAAWVEEFIAYTFDIHFSQWVNVAVAMSIACVKTTLVVLFFMQLKYDSPINAMIFIFTMMCVVFFLMFTMIDLGNRDTINRIEASEVIVGGTGFEAGPVAPAALAEAESGGANAHLLHHHHHDHEHSSAQMARPIEHVTLEEFMDAGHGDDHHDDLGGH